MILESQRCLAVRCRARIPNVLHIALVLLVLAPAITQPVRAQGKPATEQLFHRLFDS